MFFLQALFFMAVAFGLGCLFGCWLKGRKASAHHSGAAAAVTHEGAAHTTTASELAAPRPHYEPATSPQPASALTATPKADVKTSEATGTAPASAAPAPVKKTSKGKAAKPAAAKSSPGKTKAAAAKPKSADPKPRRAKAAGAAAAKSKAEKPSAAKPAAAKPAAPKAPKAMPAAAATPDNLKQIKGVGPQIEAKLNAAGINSFAQIASWTKKQQVEFAEQLSFSGRIEREEWVSQAKTLAKGGSTDFAKRVAKGEVASSAASKPKRAGKK